MQGIIFHNDTDAPLQRQCENIQNIFSFTAAAKVTAGTWNPAVRCWNRAAARKWAAGILLSLAGILLCAAGTELLQENGLLEFCCPLLESCCALMEPSCCIKMGRWNLTPFGFLKYKRVRGGVGGRDVSRAVPGTHAPYEI